MHYIFESILVGIYSGVIAIILSFALHNYYYLLFLTGFIKHVCGYYLNIHTYYCNYGDACMRMCNGNNNNNILISKNKPTQLIFESIIEGLAYIVGGFICSFFISLRLAPSEYNRNTSTRFASSAFSSISNMYISVFIVGIAMHILSELLGIHRFFCKNRCVKLI